LNRKILGEEKLNESTLKALQAEQERQLRLNGGNQVDPSYLTVPLDLVEVATVKGKETSANSSDQSICIIDDMGTQIQAKDEITKVKEEDDDDEDDESLLDDSQSETKGEDEDDDIIPISASSYTPNNRVRNSSRLNVLDWHLSNGVGQSAATSKIEEDINDDDDDDCRIISESEHLQDQLLNKKYTRGIHMNDELNIPDANGQVLINVNHPSEDSDVYILPFLAKNIKSHQIGGIRFIYDNIVETLSRVKDKSSGFGCILALVAILVN
jgi:hypothetical protein